jgi:hypothetical protein
MKYPLLALSIQLSSRPHNMKSSIFYLFLFGLSITHASSKQARTDSEDGSGSEDGDCLGRAETNNIVALDLSRHPY